MIGMLTGKVAYVENGACLLEAGGVGYEVLVPTTALAELAQATGEVRLYTHLQVREDGLQLFGFLSPDEKRSFERLIAVSGVGPKTALAILSALSVERLRQAVAAEDFRLLATVPGVGQKTAQRLVLELKGKLAPGRGAGPAAPPGGAGSAMADAVEALVALGYQGAAAIQAVEAAVAAGEGDTAPALVRASLKRLSSQ